MHTKFKESHLSLEDQLSNRNLKKKTVYISFAKFPAVFKPQSQLACSNTLLFFR